MSFEEKLYYRKLARKKPEEFKALIRSNEEALRSYIKMYGEKIEGLKTILKEVQDGSS